MNGKTMTRGAFLAFCLIGMLVLPAAAAPPGQGTNANANVIDSGLKNDLWDNHHQYRLREFDMHVERATSVIGILDKYSIDTSQMQGTLATISSKRSTLETVLTNKDMEGLKTINADLFSLWKQFRAEMRESTRAYYTKARAAAKTGATGTSGESSSPILLPASATL